MRKPLVMPSLKAIILNFQGLGSIDDLFLRKKVEFYLFFAFVNFFAITTKQNKK